MRRRVIKIGGSCLSNPQLPRQFRDWLAQQPAAENFVVVGGGECIEAMRDLDRRFSLDPVAMHWRCVRLLRATFEILGELFPEFHRLETPDQLKAATTSTRHAIVYLVAIDAFYSQHPDPQSPSCRLPVGWETTTDSIAAYLAERTSATELVLIKSCEVPRGEISQQHDHEMTYFPSSSDLTNMPLYLAQQGIVDQAFPSSVPAKTLIRICKLQDDFPNPEQVYVADQSHKEST